MKIWSWNCRGIKTDVNPTIPFISSIVKSLSVDVVFLSELKCPAAMLEASVRSLGFNSWFGVDAGANVAGGLLLCWSLSESRNSVVLR